MTNSSKGLPHREIDVESREKIEIEAQLFEQDHRALTVIKRFFCREKWAKSDPRRRASVVALVYLLFFSPTAIGAGGGLLALLTLGALLYQNHLLKEQNSQQQLQINQQIQAQQEQEERDAYLTLTNATDSAPQVKRVALELLQDRRDRNALKFVNKKATEEELLLLDLRDSFLDRLDLKGFRLLGIRLDGASMVDTHLDGSTLSNVQLMSSDISCNMSGVMVKDCVFDGSRIRPLNAEPAAAGQEVIRYSWSGQFSNCSFRNAEFAWIVLRNVAFENCDFEAAQFTDVCFNDLKFIDCVFRGAVVFQPCFETLDSNSSFAGSRFIGVEAPDEFLEWVSARGGTVEE